MYMHAHTHTQRKREGMREKDRPKKKYIQIKIKFKWKTKTSLNLFAYEVTIKYYEKDVLFIFSNFPLKWDIFVLQENKDQTRSRLINDRCKTNKWI